MRGRIPVVIFLLLWLPLSILSPQEKEKSPEYQAKAVFISRIAMFVEWPEDSNLKDKLQPLVLGIVGESPIKKWVEKAYRHEENRIKNKKVEIRYPKTPGEVTGCNLLFISRSAEEDLPKILEITKNKPILTFGDTEGFAEKGVHINLLLKSGRVRYEINPLTLQDSKLSVKFQLYKFASKAVGTREESNEDN